MSPPFTLAMLHPTVGVVAPRSEPLESPIRNRYFYGKLLDALHLEMEQRYGIDKRWLLNRHGLGTGVMCGLSIALSGDKRRIMINPGVALDALGREIIVPQRTAAIDPRQLSDDLGLPDGAPLTVGVLVVIGIAYHECDVEPTASLACECDDGCEYGAVRERYAVIVRRGTGVGGDQGKASKDDKTPTKTEAASPTKAPAKD